MTPPPATPRWLLPACIAGLLALAALPLLLTGGEPLLAWRGAEVWGHGWTWWWHGEALPAWPAGTDLATGTAEWPVIDPLPSLLGAVLTRLLGIGAAWNTVALGAIAGAFAAGWWLARRAGGHGPVGGVVLAMAPIFTGSLLSGLSEDLAIGLLAVAVGLVVIPGATSWRWAATTGIHLGLLAWCGPYLAWLGAATAVVAGLVHLIRQPRSWGRWVLAGAIAGLMALPPLLAHGARALTGQGHRSGVQLVQSEPLWQLNPWGQADLLSFVTPGAAALPADAVIRIHPGYLGLAVLVLALLAGRSRWWWPLLAALLVAPGEQLHLLGESAGLPNPFALALDWLPGGARLNHHARLLMLGQVALAVLAARGVRRLAARPGWRPGLVVGIAGLVVLLDYGLLAPVPWPLPAASARAPDFLSELDELSPGMLLWLPTGGPGISPQRPLLDQRAHGRAMVLNPNRPGPPTWLPKTPLGGWLAGLGRNADAPPPPDPDVGPLLEHGVTVLAVAAPLDATVAAKLGPPPVQGEDGAAWDLVVVAEGADMLIEESAP